MARFGRSFVQAATQPAFTQGLFTAAAGLGSAPRRRREEEEERKRMGMLRDMGAVERADYMASVAETPQELMQATAAKDQAVRQGSLTSLRGLEAARQAAGTVEEKQRIEEIMSRVAVQAGVDPTTIAGRTQAEQDAETNREFTQARLKNQQRQEQEAAISQAYYNVPPESREQFEQNVVKSGFGNVIDELKEDKARDELFQLQLKNAKTQAAENVAMKKEPLPTSSLQDRINQANIDPQLKDQFLSELAEVKQPDFEAGETWNPGERKQAETSLESLNRAVRAEVSKEVGRKNAIRSDIRTLEKQKTSPPTKAQIDEQLEQAKKDVVTTGFFGGDVEDDPVLVRQRATELARLVRDKQLQDLIDQRLDELGEQAVTESVETKEEEESTQLTTKADEIVGL